MPPCSLRGRSPPTNPQKRAPPLPKSLRRRRRSSPIATWKKKAMPRARPRPPRPRASRQAICPTSICIRATPSKPPGRPPPLAAAPSHHRRHFRKHAMNRLLATAIATSLALTSPAWADDAHHPEQDQQAATPAKPAPKAAVTPPAAKPDPALQKMQANLKAMKGQLDRIAAAKTDAERRQAIAEHFQTMQDNMRLAQGMAGRMGCPMMDGGMMMGGGDTAKRMEQMEKRMDMMQMMLERAAPRPEGAAPAPAK